MVLALAVVAVGLVVGGVVGVTAGIAGGWVDSVLMRVTDLFLALPSTLVAIAIVAALGQGLTNTLVGISIVWWPYYAGSSAPSRSIAARPHVEAAGWPASAGPDRVPARGPGAVPTAIVTASLEHRERRPAARRPVVPRARAAVPRPGTRADTAANTQLLLSAWWVPVVPGVAVLVLSLVANLAGDGIRTLVTRR